MAFSIRRWLLLIIAIAALFYGGVYVSKILGIGGGAYLDYGFGVGNRIPIPEEIVRSKNCAEFFKWQNENIGPMLPRHRCPWMEYSNIRHIEIDDLKLNIPRGYLIGSSAIEPDGPELEGILLSFAYPDIKGEAGYKRNFVDVFITPPRMHLAYKHPKEEEFLKYDYWSSFLRMEKEESKYEVIEKEFNQSLQRKHYVIKEIDGPVSNEYIEKYKKESTFTQDKIDKQVEWLKNKKVNYFYHHVYTNSDPLNPSEFIICDDGEDTVDLKKFCKSTFFYKGVYIKMNFPKRLLEQFNNYKQEFLKLMEQWSEGNDIK